MAMTPEEKRKRERERKARQRAAKREAAVLEALPQIGPRTRAQHGTDGGTPARDELDDLSNLSAAKEVIRGLTVPTASRWRIALILSLAADLDAPLAIPQRAGLAARYAENLDALVAACKPRERDELDELRRKFYSGGVGAIDDDPEAPQRRTVRKKA